VLDEEQVSRAEAAAALQEALALVASSYVDEVDPDTLYQAAVAGMLAHLDQLQGFPGNASFAADQPDPFQELVQGVYQGIGVELMAVPGKSLLVMEVYDNGPAWNAGLQAGEAIIAMGGLSFYGRTVPEMYQTAARLSGRPVELEVIDFSGEIRLITVAPGEFVVPGVRLISESSTVAVVRVAHFGQGTAEALAQMLGQLGPCPVVLDLRDNPGGLLEEAVATADLFLEADSILGMVRRRDTAERPLMARTPAVHTDGLAVLVNAGTASVAELFASALQEQGRAVLVGTPTAGRASGAEIHELSDGMRIRLLAETYRSPQGRTWAGTGLWPDVLIDVVPLITISPLALPPDPQLEAATRVVATR
jgi:carboxyl-terminal processing protease